MQINPTGQWKCLAKLSQGICSLGITYLNESTLPFILKLKITPVRAPAKR